MQELAIFGAGTLAKLAGYYASVEMGLKIRAYVVDEQYKTADEFSGEPLLSWREFKDNFNPTQIVLHSAIGYRDMRRRIAIYERVKREGYELITITSHSAYIAANATLGDNNLIMPGVVVEPGVSLGSNNVIWSNSVVCHDSWIGSHNFIAANSTIGGQVSIGDNNFLGFSSVVLHGKKMGNETVLGAKSLLLADTEDLGVYYGSPAVRKKTVDSSRGIRIA